MRVMRGMAALAVLLLGLVAAPIVLLAAGPTVGAEEFLTPDAWLRPDNGRVLVALSWCIGWVAWALFVVLVVIEALGFGQQRRRRVLRGPRAVVASLLIAVMALGSSHAHAAPPTLVTITEEQPEPPPERPETYVMHEVQRGESLWVIAEKYYGDGAQWRRIVAENPALVDPDEIEIGTQLRIPGVQRVEEPEQIPLAQLPTEAAEPEPEPVPPAPPQMEPRFEVDQTLPNPKVIPTDPDATTPAELGALVLAGAHVGLLAGTGLAALWRRQRAVQLAMRPVGRRLVPPPDDATELVAKCDPPQVQDLDLVLRAVAAHCGDEVPAMASVVVTAQDIRVTLVDPPPAPPWARQHEGAWIIDPHAEIPDEPVFNPWPALMSVGEGLGGEVFIDVDRGITALDGDEKVVSEFLEGWIVDALGTCWSDDLEVWVVADHPTVTAADVGHVRCVDEEDLVRFATQATDPAESGRNLRAAGQDADPVHVVICPSPLGPATWDAIADLVEQGSLSVVTSERRARPIQLNAPPDFSLLPDGTAFVARAVAPDTSCLLARTFAVLGGNETEPAAWWSTGSSDPPSLPDPEFEENLPDNVVRIHPDRTTPRAMESVDVNTSEAKPPHPVVHVLGPLDVVGARGPEPSRARRSCVEMAVWLLEHPGSTSRTMVRDLLVAESTRRSNLSRLRQWLGRDDNGVPYVPEAYGGRITMSGDVISDWNQMQLLTFGGVDRASTNGLTMALQLVRGAPLSDAAPTQWQWAEVLRTDAMSCIRDIGVELCRRALKEGDIDLARWSAARALSAVGDDEQLLVCRIRTEMRAGNHGEIPRLAMRVTQQARSLNVDLADETVALLQKAMEGALRGAS